MNTSNPVKFRIITMLVAALLGLQCIWLVLSELARPAVVGLPTNVTAAAGAAREHDRAALAATIGAIRGELWAQSAFTYADRLFGENEESTVVITKLARARVSLERALHDAPAQPAAWLFRAGLGARYPTLGFNAMEALKMCYYTGPSEEQLIPLRLRLAVFSGAIGDAEIGPLVRRDLRLLLARKQQAIIADAYSAASPSGKRFIEQALSDIDRSAAESLRKGPQNRALPD